VGEALASVTVDASGADKASQGSVRESSLTWHQASAGIRRRGEQRVSMCSGCRVKWTDESPCMDNGSNGV
jgi:hypothetical protein